MTAPRTKRTKSSLESAPLSFLKFVRRLQSEEPVMAEFAAIIKGDRSFPEIATWQEVRRYLNKIGAPHAAFIGGRLAWREYKRAQKEQARVF